MHISDCGSNETTSDRIKYFLRVPAMKQEGVRRILTVTGFGSGDSREAIGLLLRVPFCLDFGRAYDENDAQKMLIRRSSLDWTFVRPGVLRTGGATGRYRVLTEPASWRNGLISRTDVAPFIVGQIDRQTYQWKAVVLIVTTTCSPSQAPDSIVNV